MPRAVLFVLLLSCLGCGGADETTTAPQAAMDVDPEDATILMRPFTADQIRNEWVEGFRLLMRRSSSEETRIERWTVVAADEEGAEIEFATVADDGTVVGEPTAVRSTWSELRDHAAFPTAYSSREWVSRSTMLGDFEGWLYRVTDPDSAVVSEFFFVPSLPGAPVQMRILEGETTILELEQTARLRPDVG